MGSLAVVQAISHTATKADKMTQGIEVRVIEDPEVLVGDGDGETPPEVVPAQEIQNTIEQPQDATPVLAEEQQQEASAPAEEHAIVAAPVYENKLSTFIFLLLFLIISIIKSQLVACSGKSPVCLKLVGLTLNVKFLYLIVQYSSNFL